MRRGFVIHYADGSIYDEWNDGVWDDAPDKGIHELHYVWGSKVEVVKDCDLYFFSNEAIHGPALSGAPGIWQAGIIGGIRNGTAHWIRVSSKGETERHVFGSQYLRFEKHVYRKGVRQ